TLASASLFLLIAGCGDSCNMGELPPGGLPVDQTIEGGGQVRVTPAGFDKLTDLIPAAINDVVADGFCIGDGEWGNAHSTCAFGTYYCNSNQGGACGSGLGCDLDIHIDSVNL